MTVDSPGSGEPTSSYFRCHVYFDANADANRRSILDHTGPTTTRDGPLMTSEGKEALGYDHGYDGEIFYLSLALDPAYVEGFVEGCLERIGEDDAEGEDLLRSEWEEGYRDMVLEILKAECDVRVGRPE